MGLDMYLYKETYIGGQYALNKDTDIEIHKENEPVIHIKVGDISSLKKRVIYWRKNYAINEWLIDKICGGGDDNCVYFNVEHETLEELKDILGEIIKQDTKEKKLKVAQEKLNTADLVQWFDFYIDDFERTYRELEEIINSEDFLKSDFYYCIWY